MSYYNLSSISKRIYEEETEEDIFDQGTSKTGQRNIKETVNHKSNLRNLNDGFQPRWKKKFRKVYMPNSTFEEKEKRLLKALDILRENMFE